MEHFENQIEEHSEIIEDNQDTMSDIIKLPQEKTLTTPYSLICVVIKIKI